MAHLTPEGRKQLDMSLQEWKPERKIVAAAVATLIMFVVGMVWPALDVPAGLEAAIATILAYLIPNSG